VSQIGQLERRIQVKKAKRRQQPVSITALKGLVRKPRTPVSIEKMNLMARKPHYRLSDLLAQMPPGRIDLDEEMQAWENMTPVGSEIL
jgi:hypothetical protein